MALTVLTAFSFSVVRLITFGQYLLVVRALRSSFAFRFVVQLFVAALFRLIAISHLQDCSSQTELQPQLPILQNQIASAVPEKDSCHHVYHYVHKP